MNNQLQILLEDSLTSTGHVENCAVFRRKDVLLRGSSNGFTVRYLEIQKFGFKHTEPFF